MFYFVCCIYIIEVGTSWFIIMYAILGTHHQTTPSGSTLFQGQEVRTREESRTSSRTPVYKARPLVAVAVS
jgi:hypothetical protein